MHVVMVNRNFYPFLGGVEFHVLNLAQELLAAGDRVTVVTQRLPDRPAAEDFRGVRVCRMSSWVSRRALGALRPDIVHVHMPRNILAWRALEAARGCGVPSVFTPHCFYPPRVAWHRFAKPLADRTVTRRMLRLADATIALTPNDLADATARGLTPERAHVIPNSVRLAEFEGLVPVDPRTHLGLTDPFLLHVGRFDPVKNIPFLVRAHRAFPDLGLVLAGPADGGSTLAEVRGAVRACGLEARVRILERMSFSELCGAYRAAAAVVLASSYEGLPTVLLEAWHYGRPVVASRVGGTPYALTTPELGALFEVGDEAGYVGAVRSVLTADRAAAETVRRRHVAERFSWEVNAPKIRAVYRSLTGSGRP
jgi:glycosyltransferase involved in cell wall biosynthesis